MCLCTLSQCPCICLLCPKQGAAYVDAAALQAAWHALLACRTRYRCLHHGVWDQLMVWRSSLRPCSFSLRGERALLPVALQAYTHARATGQRVRCAPGFGKSGCELCMTHTLCCALSVYLQYVFRQSTCAASHCCLCAECSAPALACLCACLLYEMLCM